MVSKSKAKGSGWERDLTDMLNKKYPNSWKKVPTSGAMGTLLEEPTLYGDVKGNLYFIEKPFRIEAKVGYGGDTQLTVKKEWLDKIRKEASELNAYPLLACKFSGARAGTKYFIALDIDTFLTLLDEMQSNYDELAKLYEYKNNHQ